MLVNAKAGTAEEAAVDRAVAVLAERSPARVVPSEDPDQLDGLLAGLGEEQLVVAGGDGSLHLVLDRLRRAGRLATTPIGLVPLGTGNDFARGQGLPLDPAGAARRVVDGRRSPLHPGRRVLGAAV